MAARAADASGSSGEARRRRRRWWSLFPQEQHYRCSGEQLLLCRWRRWNRHFSRRRFFLHQYARPCLPRVAAQCRQCAALAPTEAQHPASATPNFLAVTAQAVAAAVTAAAVADHRPEQLPTEQLLPTQSGATAPTGGGNGGNAASSSSGNGTAGSAPGGGGGGAYRSSGSSTYTGGNGAAGQVRSPLL